MKCLLKISFLWITISYSYGQIILVNHSDYEQSKYSPKQLVEEVLIVSDCSEIGNFSSQVYGQPDDLSSKSYGYFKTPNGSSYHDTWNISSLKSQANAKIYIFDRYGKLLKMISPASRGWDGTFNGKPMPASDYWFLIEYLDSGKAAKHFRAHFTLKR